MARVATLDRLREADGAPLVHRSAVPDDLVLAAGGDGGQIGAAVERVYDVGVAGLHRLLARGKDLAYNTVQTMLRLMEDKGLVDHQVAGRTFIYTPRFTREARECVLTRIIDGDSIECSPLGPVRLIGTDSPEADQPPFGTAATAGLASLVPSGATLRLELDAEERDQYGRVLAYAWYDARMINWLMVRHGWSVSYRYPPNVRYAAVLDSAEAAARREARGLWLVDGFRCRPAERRRQAC